MPPRHLLVLPWEVACANGRAPLRATGPTPICARCHRTLSCTCGPRKLHDSTNNFTNCCCRPQDARIRRSCRRGGEPPQLCPGPFVNQSQGPPSSAMHIRCVPIHETTLHWLEYSSISLSRISPRSTIIPRRASRAGFSLYFPLWSQKRA